MAIDASRCLRCTLCAGFVCPTGARGSAAQLLDAAQGRGLALTVRTRVEVERLARERGTGATLITVLDRANGRRQQYRARRYALAAGAFGSPMLLLRSGTEHPLIGRNYMMHLCAIVAGIYPQATNSDSSFIKHVGFTDFYFATNKYLHKMGLVQSLAVPGPVMTARASPFLPDGVRRFLIVDPENWTTG